MLMTSLCGADDAALTAALTEAGVAPAQTPMRVRQIKSWLYVHGVRDFAAMHNIGHTLRDALESRHTLARPHCIDEQCSEDGTRKWLFRLEGGATVETVYIPEATRGTLCISSQVGCTLTCRFYHTGTQRFGRNLTAGEIVGQYMAARDTLDDWPNDTDSDETRKITNIVFMGQGEPLFNPDEVATACRLMTDAGGLAMSRRRITVSTAGVVPQIAPLGAATGVMLAVSLHATNDELRNQLVPLNKKYPIAELLEACRAYPGLSNARRITFEYVMLDGINDSDDEARALVRLLAGIPAKINLIPFNPWPGAPYTCAPWERIERFAEIVNRAGYAAPVRAPRGRDIMAACGQLKSAQEAQA